LNHAAGGLGIPDGALFSSLLVATRDKHLAILHLRHGKRRVTIEEAEALLAGAPSTPPVP
jgi:hypothetical protein